MTYLHVLTLNADGAQCMLFLQPDLPCRMTESRCPFILCADVLTGACQQKGRNHITGKEFISNNTLRCADYLRDNLAQGKEGLVLRGFNFCIIDEVDSILIDEARTPLIISGPAGVHLWCAWTPHSCMLKAHLLLPW